MGSCKFHSKYLGLLLVKAAFYQRLNSVPGPAVESFSEGTQRELGGDRAAFPWTHRHSVSAEVATSGEPRSGQGALDERGLFQTILEQQSPVWTAPRPKFRGQTRSSWFFG